MLSSLYLRIKNLVQEQSGQDLIEYALIIVLLVIAAIAGLGALGTDISGLWATIQDSLD